MPRIPYCEVKHGCPRQARLLLRQEGAAVLSCGPCYYSATMTLLMSGRGAVTVTMGASPFRVPVVKVTP